MQDMDDNQGTQWREKFIEDFESKDSKAAAKEAK